MSADQVPILKRSLAILEYVAGRPRGCLQSEIATALDCPPSSVFRITNALVEAGYLERHPKHKVLRLTPKMFNVGQQALSSGDLVGYAIDAMRDLRDLLRDTILIGVLNQTDVVVLEQVLGHHMFKFAVNAGTRASAYCSAPGKAILAFLPRLERDAVIRRTEFVRHTPTTITDAEALRRELAQIAKQGYAIDRAEEFAGIYCVAAPVFDRYGYPVAAIWVTGPEVHVTPADFPRIGGLVSAHALRISQSLGFASRETR